MIEHRGDIHHIFPRQYLKENGFSQIQYNQVANYVYVVLNPAILKDKAWVNDIAEIIRLCKRQE
jgi:hypothetical protein